MLNSSIAEQIWLRIKFTLHKLYFHILMKKVYSSKQFYHHYGTARNWVTRKEHFKENKDFKRTTGKYL